MVESYNINVTIIHYYSSFYLTTVGYNSTDQVQIESNDMVMQNFPSMPRTILKIFQSMNKNKPYPKLSQRILFISFIHKMELQLQF